MRLPVIENSKASAEHGVGEHNVRTSRRIGRSETRSKILIVGNARLELIAQAEHEGTIRPQAHVVLEEGIDFVRWEVHQRVADVHLELCWMRRSTLHIYNSRTTDDVSVIPTMN